MQTEVLELFEECITYLTRYNIHRCTFELKLETNCNKTCFNVFLDLISRATFSYLFLFGNFTQCHMQINKFSFLFTFHSLYGA